MKSYLQSIKIFRVFKFYSFCIWFFGFLYKKERMKKDHAKHLISMHKDAMYTKHQARVLKTVRKAMYKA